MDRKRMDAQEQEDLLLYLESMLRCVNALHASVGEVMADVVTMRDAILEDQQELAMPRRGKKPAKESAKLLDGLYTDPSYGELSYGELMIEIARTQQYTN